MNIKSVKIISVGKLKTPFWKDAYTNYATRIKHFFSLHEFIVKDGDSSYNPSMRMEREGEGILKHIQANDYVICLDEHGKNFSSTEFANFCDLKALEKNLCFIIGGAYGLSTNVLSSSSMRLSFGKQTFPHELALVLLSEQLFRVCAILKKTGYHHD